MLLVFRWFFFFFFSLFSSNGTFLNLPSIVLMNKRDIKSSSCSRGSVIVERRSENLPRLPPFIISLRLANKTPKTG